MTGDFMRYAIGNAIVLCLIGTSPLAAQNFEMVPPNMGDGAPSVIGGEPASPSSYPATFIFRTPSGGCTSTAVGKRTILTAAHCVGNGATGTVQIQAKKIGVKCEHHPDYAVNQTVDFALCLSDADITGMPFENVNTSIAYPKVGDEIRLLGYGCRKEEGVDHAFGVLYTGKAKVTRVPKGEDIDTISQGRAALCFGDSGGAAYVDLVRGGAVRVIFGVNSRGNISDTSYLSTTATPAFVDFAQLWSKKNGDVAVCGVTLAATGCR
jgi:hypothetical protein